MYRVLSWNRTYERFKKRQGGPINVQSRGIGQNEWNDRLETR